MQRVVAHQADQLNAELKACFDDLHVVRGLIEQPGFHAFDRPLRQRDLQNGLQHVDEHGGGKGGRCSREEERDQRGLLEIRGDEG